MFGGRRPSYHVVKGEKEETMGLSCGLIGLPNVGKTSVFNALVGAGGVVANYPFSTVETNIGVAVVPDVRLSTLTKIFHSQKVTPSTLEVRDIAGLVQGASHGEGLGNQFLAQIREVDVLLHLVRCFPDSNVMHVAGDVNPARDIEVIESELLLADLATLERRRERIEKRAKTGDAKLRVEHDLVRRLEELLNEGQWLYGKAFSVEEQSLLKDYQLLATKPVLFVANVSEEMKEDDPLVQSVMEVGRQKGIRTILLAGQTEAELATLSEADRAEFFQALGLKESGLQKLIAAANEMLGLITFFTAGEEESRAWTIQKQTIAQEAAGKIHSDMQRGFIRAEVFSYADLMACGSPAAVREKGLFRLEGREYIVQDGDIMYFRFNV